MKEIISGVQKVRTGRRKVFQVGFIAKEKKIIALKLSCREKVLWFCFDRPVLESLLSTDTAEKAADSCEAWR